MSGGFEHVAVLLSFVYALAITHLFSGVARLILARDRTRFSGLLSLHILLTVLLLIDNWIALWDLHSRSRWDMPGISFQFLFATALYFCAFFVTPDETDMAAHFQRQRQAIFTCQLIGILLAMIANMQAATPHQLMAVNLALLPSLLLILARLAFASPWVQWISGLASLALTARLVLQTAPVLG